MYENLKGKRLLFLGATRPLCEAVDYAKEMGIYTVVTDYFPDSPAKKHADKACMVSTTDVDALVELCKQEKIDGVFTAYMDGMLPYARELSDRMGFHFYASREQIRLSRDKRFFKQTCMDYGVPVPTDYTEEVRLNGVESENITFPVIVKPVDMYGGRGITICRNVDELRDAYEYAMEFSPSKTVLVEEYMIGDEITATYTIKNGEISLSVMRDKYISHDNPDIQSQGDVLLNPSKDTKRFTETTDIAIKRMLKGMKATDGSVFFQGISNKDKIAVFEMGYRPNGALDYRHISRENGINYMKMMIAHALTGEMQGYDLSMDNPFFSNFSATFNLWAHPGIIGSMTGIEEVLKIENVQLAEYRHDVGEEVPSDKPLLQQVFRAIIVDNDIKRVQETITKIQNAVKIEDINGNNMLYKPFDINRLNGVTL